MSKGFKLKKIYLMIREFTLFFSAQKNSKTVSEFIPKICTRQVSQVNRKELFNSIGKYQNILLKKNKLKFT